MTPNITPLAEPPLQASVTLQDGSGQTVDRLPFVLRRLRPLLQGLTVGGLTISLPDARVLVVDGPQSGPEVAMSVHRWRLFRRAGLRGDVGLGEAFADGDWTSPDLALLLEYFAANTVANGDQFTPGGFGGWVLSLYHMARANSPRMARRNIAAHYDLGNAFYATWLDPSMTYSAALFSDGAADLEAAQIAKYRALISGVGIGPDDHILEIGCGWGGFACLAAQQTGCQVTAVTLSPAQRAYAEERIARAGLQDRVTVVEADYRSLTGLYDHIISIEMIEAVGEQYWSVFFDKVASLLRPGGRFGLQAITIGDADFQEYRRRPDFLQTYIFPGGMLLPEQAMRDMAQNAGLTAGPARGFGLDYARTLADWHDRFLSAWPEIEAQGFDPKFRDMWRFYLAMCEAGFKSGLIDVSQTVFVRS